MNVSSPSIRDLIRLSFSEPTRWYSGEQRQGTVVHWVVLEVREIRPDDLLILAPASLSPEILSQSVDRQAAGILVLGDLPASDLAFPAELPVMSVATSQEPYEAQRVMLAALINQHAAYLERSLRIHRRLSQIAIEGAGLEGLARAMTEISGEGVLVQDKRMIVAAECPAAPLLGIWDDVIKYLSTSNSLPELFRDRKLAGQQPVPMNQSIPGGLERLILPITVGGVARGYLSLIGLAGSLDILDHLVLEQGASVCAVEMARNKAVREAEKRLKGDMITALLQEDISAADARLWAQAMDVDLNQAYVALRFAWAGVVIPSRRRLETLLHGEAARRGSRVVINSMGVEVICFYQLLPDSGRPEAALEFGQAVLDQGSREYPDTPIRCGVGTPALELGAWRVSFRQAGQALEMARRFAENRPLLFSDLSIYRLLLQIEHNPELAAFQEEMLGLLLAHENGRELIHTLEAYFENNGNLAQAAESLHVHRNTLIYRIERIAAITGLDLNDPETRLAVHLALHIDRMMGTHKS